MAASLPPTPFDLLMYPFQRTVQLLSNPMIKDALSILVLGAVAEGARRSVYIFWEWLLDQIYITSAVKPGEEAYDWLFYFWCSHPSWTKRARNFDLQTQYTPGLGHMPWHNDDDDDTSAAKVFAPRFVPKMGTSHIMSVNGHYFRFSRVENAQSGENRWYDPKERLVVTTIARSHQPFIDLLIATRQDFQNRDAVKLVIRMTGSDSGRGNGTWGTTIRRHKRSFDTVIVEEGVKELLLRDVGEFLEGEKYYVDRGIPWRRGYLLHGKPGTGKTSTIHALASELNLDVYVVQLAASGMNDEKLNEAMTAVPQRSIVVMEDIDAATVKRASSDEPDLEESDKEKQAKGELNPNKEASARDKAKDKAESKVSLSGLLNALDGLAGSEGRVLIMTTNHRDKLDPALIRPGRADLHIEYKLANKPQATEIFRRFYPVDQMKALSEKPLAPATIGPAATAMEDLRWSKVLVDELSKEWEDRIPDREFSVSQLQGLLMLNKTSPQDAIRNLPTWIDEQQQEAASKSAKALEMATKEEARMTKKDVQAEKAVQPKAEAANGDAASLKGSGWAAAPVSDLLSPPRTPKQDDGASRQRDVGDADLNAL